MRAILSVLIAVVMAGPGASELLAQTDRAPVFRSGVEVMEVDVTVVDAKGMPVRDLRAPEFTVTVDGQVRRVISAEFVAESGESAADAAKPRDPYVSNNTDRRPGRLIMLVVDRNNIDTHTIRGAVAALKRFVAGVSPDDRLALVTIPPPGPSVDFTTNHAQILSAITNVMGSEDPMFSQYNISDYEAITFENRSNPIVTQRLLFRTCGDTDPNTMSPCDRDVEQEALTKATHLRQLTSQSVSGFAALLRNLRDVEGPKSMIILSQGLMLEGAQGESSALATLAAEARVSINVMMFDQVVGSASQSRISETISQDRDMRETGLETLAGRSRGSLFRVVTNPEFVFERLRHEISAHYMLGVEPAERDRDGKPHQIQVKVGRQNVQVRARRQVQYTRLTPNSWSRDVVMGRVLRSPAANTELPMRLATYTFRDTAPNKVKLILAAEIDPESMEKELDLAIGFAIFDDMGKVVLSGQERKIYSANTDLPIRYELAVPVDPGQYRLRLAAVDMSGKSGSVEREVPAFGMANQEFAIGDLILSSVREGRGNDLRAPVVVQVADGQLATYTELYTNKPGMLDDTKVTFEIADTADGPALQSSNAEIRERGDQTMRQALSVVPVGALPPGRYIARAVFSKGDKNIGKLSRPFNITAKALTGATGAKGATGARGATGATGAQRVQWVPGAHGCNRCGRRDQCGRDACGDDGRRGGGPACRVQEGRCVDTRDAASGVRNVRQESSCRKSSDGARAGRQDTGHGVDGARSRRSSGWVAASRHRAPHERRFESGRESVRRGAAQCARCPDCVVLPRRVLCRGGEGQGSCVVLGARPRGEAGRARAAACDRRRVASARAARRRPRAAAARAGATTAG